MEALTQCFLVPMRFWEESEAGRLSIQDTLQCSDLS
jgi:hypothetical protein